MVFEKFYYDVVKFAEDIAKAAQHTPFEGGTSRNLEQIVTAGNKHVCFEYNRHPKKIKGSSLNCQAYLYSLVYPQTVVNKRTGKTREMEIPAGTPVIHLNVANIYAAQYKNFSFQNKYIKFIKRIKGVKTAAYRIDSKMSDKDFENLCRELTKTYAFEKTVSHELQHHVGPATHRWEEEPQDKIHDKIRNLKYPGTNKQKIAHFKYINSDEEVNSSIAEVLTHAKNMRYGRRAIEANNIRLFIMICINELKRLQRWDLYSDEIQKKILKKLSINFYELVKNYRRYH